MVIQVFTSYKGFMNLVEYIAWLSKPDTKLKVGGIKI